MKIVVTGGAGFIGCNIASRYAKKDHHVIVIDNLSRAGTEKNRDWLLKTFPKNITFEHGDIRKEKDLTSIKNADLVFHMAAQVAVTTSVTDPRSDFEINALGTFNVLEAVRTLASKAIVIYASTNKVYGSMESVGVKEIAGRWEYVNPTLRRKGVPETLTLDFHSPYGCSKGTGDQYARDYHRIFGLKTIVFRQSCIYGPRQFGNEDQGWVMYFTRSALAGRSITIYGDGKQIRDILHVDDLLDAYDCAINRIEKTAGQIFNIGGGPTQTISLLELIASLEKTLGRKIKLNYDDWRSGDQKVYVSCIRKAKQDIGWKSKIEVETGLSSLLAWAKTLS
ncbi:MAG: GDP-mannose 4,6-dehydratase [bacterium]|nr:GDP-mannose 4,6-dehydratase [bacterium]